MAVPPPRRVWDRWMARCRPSRSPRRVMYPELSCLANYQSSANQQRNTIWLYFPPMPVWMRLSSGPILPVDSTPHLGRMSQSPWYLQSNMKSPQARLIIQNCITLFVVPFGFRANPRQSQTSVDGGDLNHGPLSMHVLHMLHVYFRLYENAVIRCLAGAGSARTVRWPSRPSNG